MQKCFEKKKGGKRGKKGKNLTKNPKMIITQSNSLKYLLCGGGEGGWDSLPTHDRRPARSLLTPSSALASIRVKLYSDETISP